MPKPDITKLNLKSGAAIEIHSFPYDTNTTSTHEIHKVVFTEPGVKKGDTLEGARLASFLNRHPHMLEKFITQADFYEESLLNLR